MQLRHCQTNPTIWRYRTAVGKTQKTTT